MGESDMTSIFGLLDDIFSTQINIPEIRYKNIIVYPRGWRIPNKMLHKNSKFVNFSDFKRSIKTYFTENKIPKIIQIQIADMYLVLNMGNDLHLRIFYNEIKNNSNLLIRKFYFSDESLMLHDSNNQKYIGEFVFEVFTNMQRNCYDKVICNFEEYSKNSLETNCIMSLDNWINVNIYMEAEELDYVTVNLYQKIMMKLYGKNATKIIFLRYNDGNIHLRFRIQYCDENYENCLKFLLHSLNEYRSEKMIKYYTIYPYFREVNRYGFDNECMELAEDFFSIDSLICTELIKMIDGKLINLDKVALYVISVFKMFKDLNFDIEDIMKFISDFSSNNQRNKKIKLKYKDLYLFVQDTTHWETLRKIRGGLNVLNCLCLETVSLKKYFEKIESLSYERKKKILLSLMHLRFNRLIGMNRELERSVLSLISNIAYKTYHLKRVRR